MYPGKLGEAIENRDRVFGFLTADLFDGWYRMLRSEQDIRLVYHSVDDGAQLSSLEVIPTNFTAATTVSEELAMEGLREALG